jgi:hypothetical protein
VGKEQPVALAGSEVVGGQSGLAVARGTMVVMSAKIVDSYLLGAKIGLLRLSQ